MTLVALNRGDIADYAAALLFVYTILIIANVILSWVQQFRPIPYNLPLRAVIGFIEQSTDPFLNIFRSFIPRIGPLDISPIVAILAISILGGIGVAMIPRVSPTPIRPWARMLVVCGLIVIADQATKGAIVSSMAPGERTDLVLGFDLARVSNSGIAFGLLDEGSDALVLAITIFSLGLIVGWFVLDSGRPGLWLGVGLLVGGALGNLVDRVRDGAVTDFIDPPLWPAFNVADIAITAGVVVIAFAAFAARPDPEPAEP